jgi:hypothetical protein
MQVLQSANLRGSMTMELYNFTYSPVGSKTCIYCLTSHTRLLAVLEVERRMPKFRAQSQPIRHLHPRIYWQEWTSASGTANVEASSDINRLLAAMENSTRSLSAKAVYVIQDITSDWQSRISRRMKLDHAFFDWHLSTSHDSATFHPWHSSMPGGQPSPKQRDEEDTQWRCIDAIYSPSNVQRTRMSYYRISDNLCECELDLRKSSY